jgi:VanZ family protein
MQRLLPVGAWGCILVLGVLSLLPGDEIVRTGVDGRIEHMVAYAGASFVIASVYARRLGPVRLAALLVVYAGLLELGQLWSPGRHSSPFDWLASSAGVVAGLIFFGLLSRRLGLARP